LRREAGVCRTEDVIVAAEGKVHAGTTEVRACVERTVVAIAAVHRFVGAATGAIIAVDGAWVIIIAFPFDVGTLPCGGVTTVEGEGIAIITSYAVTE
jgi:hypothetical protein